MSETPCPYCKGRGAFVDARYDPELHPRQELLTCGVCGGSGRTEGRAVNPDTGEIYEPVQSRARELS